MVEEDFAVPACCGYPGMSGLPVVCYFDYVFIMISTLVNEFVGVMVVDNDLAGHAGGDCDELLWLSVQEYTRQDRRVVKVSEGFEEGEVIFDM